MPPQTVKKSEELASAVPAAEKPAVVRVKVRATKLGYFGDRRRRAGDVFTVSGPPLEKDVLDRAGKILRHQGDPKAFSERWMEKVSNDVAEQSISPSEAARREHVAIMSGRATPLKPNAIDPIDGDDADDKTPTGAADVLG